MSSDAVSIYAQDHGFFITDRDVETPFETMDYSTGIAGVMPSAMLVHTGIDQGNVRVSAFAGRQGPPLDTSKQWQELAGWDDVAETSIHVAHGALTVERLEYGAFDARPNLPALSPHGPGHYRVRLYARGRDRHYDRVVDDSDEQFHIVTWPAPPTPTIIIKTTSLCSYGLRYTAHTNPAHN